MTYLLASLSLCAIGIVVVSVFGWLWNRSSMPDRYNSRFSFRMSLLCNIALLPLHLAVDTLLLWRWFG